jgi:hypothetical protein
MKLLYDTLNQASLIDSNRFYNHGLRDIPVLEPRRSNSIDRYQLSDELINRIKSFIFLKSSVSSQPSNSKQITSDYHSSGGQSYHETREHTGKLLIVIVLEKK